MKMLLILLLSIGFIPTNLLGQPTSSSERGLKDYYREFFPIGVAVTPSQIAEPEQRALILKHFNSLTAENAMKMQPIHPEENRYDWRAADAIMDFAQEHTLKVRGHALCWHNQAPGWLFVDAEGRQASKDLLLKRLKEHIFTVVSRYKGKIYAWDVVNEAISDNAKEWIRDSKWYQICGEDFIAKAFEYAHEADPNAILFYNDYNTENINKQDGIYRLLKGLKDKGIPVHGVGLQGHWSINYPSQELLKKSIQRFASLGLKVQVTELDISIYPDSDSIMDGTGYSPERQRLQSNQYNSLFQTFRQEKAKLSGVTFWNLSDRSTWLDNFPVRGRKNFPLLFDTELKPKAAYWKVIDFR